MDTDLAEESATSLGMVFNICKDGNYHEGTNTDVELRMVRPLKNGLIY